MVLNIDLWMRELLEKLTADFGVRLLFLGLQGSYQRGEAMEQSDIDVVMVLDALTLDDLSAYRRAIRTMPDHDKACGFCTGVRELNAWSRSDLFTLLHDTAAYHGNLFALAGPAPSPEDLRTSLRLSLGNLLHETCHRYLYHDDLAEQADRLKGAYKSVFYVLQTAEYLRTGQYHATRRDLAQYVGSEDRAMLDAYANWDEQVKPEARFGQLLRWCQGKLDAVERCASNGGMKPC